MSLKGKLLDLAGTEIAKKINTKGFVKGTTLLTKTFKVSVDKI